MCKAHSRAECGRLRHTTSSCECALSAHSAFYVIGNSIGITYYIKKMALIKSAIRSVYLTSVLLYISLVSRISLRLIIYE